MIKKNAVLTLPRNGCPRAIRVGRTVVVAAVYIDRGWYIMVYRYIFSRHTTWRGANITHAPREKEGAENPVLGRRVAGGAADVTGGCRRVGKAIATNNTSPPPLSTPRFFLSTMYIHSLNVYYARIYTLQYIYTLSNPPTPPDGGAGTLLRRDPPPSAREPLRANALLPRASKMEGDSR